MRLLYLDAEDSYFWFHRLPIARSAASAGFEVAVATRCRDHADRIRAEGFRVHPIRFRRGSLAPWAIARDAAEIAALYRKLRPDLVHHVGLKSVLLGGVAALAAGIPRVVNSLTGLGFAFASPGPRATALRHVITSVLGPLLRRRHSIVVVQNRDDADFLIEKGLVGRSRIRLIRGSGVDLQRFGVLPEPDGPIVAGFVGRMLEDKGVRILLDAHDRLRAQGVDLRLCLAGEPDPDNPTSLTEAELRRRCTPPLVDWMGQVEDVRAVWARSHFAVLPSRREGLPKSLLEAAACGRALVASDVPGCREIALPSENAVLVPPDDSEALAAAMRRLVEDSDLRRRMGVRSRALVESDLSAAAVGGRMLDVYLELLPSR